MKKNIEQVDIYEQMAKLWVKQDKIGLTEDEGLELDALLKINADRYWDKAKLAIMEELAKVTNDEKLLIRVKAEREYKNL